MHPPVHRLRMLRAWRSGGIVGIAALTVIATSTLLSSPLAADRTASAAASAVETTAGPSMLVRKAAQKFLQELNAHRDEYRSDPKKLRAAVDRDILPILDIRRAAQLVLGRHWRQATADQRRRFINAFEDSLLRNYGNALIDFRSNRLKVLPSDVRPRATFAIVRTRIRRDNGTTVSVNYAMRRTADGWKAWDVIIDGISYVKSFREDIGSEVEQTGLDATISHLEHG